MDLFYFSEKEETEVIGTPTVTTILKKRPETPKEFTLTQPKNYVPSEMSISNKVILKTDYRKGEYTTHQYYSQFVTKEIVDLVVSRLRKEAIIKSTKHNFSDIRQDTIDSLDGQIHSIIDQEQIRASGEDIPYLCFNVCVAIAAATIYKESIK